MGLTPASSDIGGCGVQVTRYLLRPKPFVLDFIDQRAQAVGLDRAARAVVGLHVRHGDKAYDMYQVGVCGSGCGLFPWG
eukprot:3504431-Rhodomonas_salina.4